MKDKEAIGRSHSSRPIKVTSERREEIDVNKLAMVYWMMAGRQAKDKRESMRDQK